MKLTHRAISNTTETVGRRPFTTIAVATTLMTTPLLTTAIGCSGINANMPVREVTIPGTLGEFIRFATVNGGKGVGGRDRFDGYENIAVVPLIGSKDKIEIMFNISGVYSKSSNPFITSTVGAIINGRYDFGVLVQSAAKFGDYLESFEEGKMVGAQMYAFGLDNAAMAFVIGLNKEGLPIGIVNGKVTALMIVIDQATMTLRQEITQIKFVPIPNEPGTSELIVCSNR